MITKSLRNNSFSENSQFPENYASDTLCIKGNADLSEAEIKRIFVFWKHYQLFDKPLAITPTSLRTGSEEHLGVLAMGRYHFVFLSKNATAMRRFSTSYNLNYLEALEISGGSFTGLGEMRTQLMDYLPTQVRLSLNEQLWIAAQISRQAEELVGSDCEVKLLQDEVLRFGNVHEDAKLVFADLYAIATGTQALSQLKLKPSAFSCWPSMHNGTYLRYDGAEWKKVFVSICQFQLCLFESSLSLEPLGICGIQDFRLKQLYVDENCLEIHVSTMVKVLLEKQQKLLSETKYLQDNDFYSGDQVENFVKRAEISRENVLEHVLVYNNRRQVVGLEMLSLDNPLQSTISQQYNEPGRTSISISFSSETDYLDDIQNDFHQTEKSIFYLSGDSLSGLRQFCQITQYIIKAEQMTKINFLRRRATKRQQKGELIVEASCKVLKGDQKLGRYTVKVFQQTVDKIQIGIVIEIISGKTINRYGSEQITNVAIEYNDNTEKYLIIQIQESALRLELNQQIPAFHTLISNWLWK